MFTIVLNVLKTYKKPLLIISLLLASIYVVFYIKDKYDANKVKNVTQQIDILNTKLTDLTKQKTDADEAVKDALTKYNDLKKTVAQAEHNTDIINNTPQPFIPSNTPVDCIKEMTKLNDAWKKREDVLNTEILTIRPALAQADLVIQKQAAEIVLDNSIIAAHTEKDKLTAEDIKILTSEVKSETFRKNVYKGVAISVSVAAVIVVLKHK